MTALTDARLTLEKARQALSAGSQVVRRARRRLPPLVLVVDTVEDDREFFVHWLGTHGFRVATAASGAEAFSLVLDLAPAAVLLDLVLPDLDGLAVARVLTDDGATADIPIIAISASVPGHNQVNAMEAGCRTFVAKPCPPEEVLSLLQAAVRRAG